MGTFPRAADSLDRLLRSGWLVGETSSGAAWTVTGERGGHRIAATADTRAEALYRVCLQAENLGLLT